MCVRADQKVGSTKPIAAGCPARWAVRRALSQRIQTALALQQQLDLRHLALTCADDGM